MADLTKDDILKLARLSRLRLTTEEVDEFKDEINEILSYVEMLKSVDVEGLKPTYQVTGLENKMREDKVIDYGISQADLLKNLPSSEQKYIKTKRVL